MFFRPAPRRPWPERPAGAPVDPETPLGDRPAARPMRRRDAAGGTDGREALAGESLLPAPALGAVVWNRAAFGPRPGDVAAFEALGGDDESRLVAWVDAQLDPGTIDDSACDARIAASSYATLGKSLSQLWQDHFVPGGLEWEERLQPATEVELETWTRAVYSERQLFESVVHFWHNHFSLYAYEFVEGPTFGAYDRDVVRANSLGNFRAMLGAVTHSPAMLVYLDNASNFADAHFGYSNENYAREVIELHTLGAAVSYGKVPRATIPVDGEGRPLGYCEEDVQDLARALTGWTFDIDWLSWAWGGGNSGLPVFVDLLHSTEAKTVVGVDLPAGRGAQIDGEEALDALAGHPACGRFLARKLLRRFVCDFPDATCPALLDSTAALWTALWQAPDQIAQVVRHVLLSTEFRTIWGEKVKRPFEIAVSAMRAGRIDFRFFQEIPYPANWEDWHPDFQDTSSLHWSFQGAGQELFGWHPPNGHPDVRGAWQAANPRVTLWNLVNGLVESRDGSDAFRMPILADTPAGPLSAESLVDVWLPRLFGRPVPAAMRNELVEFAAQGFNPTFELPLDTNEWPHYWQDRVRALVGLAFMSPEFLWR